MIDRGHIENFLRLNGINVAAPDEEIGSALIRAKWHRDDVEIALMVLRENVVDHTKEITTVHRLFRSDDSLNPETISALLGVDLNIHNSELKTLHFESRVRKSAVSDFFLIVIILIVASVTAYGLIYYFSLGPFYTSL